MYLYCKLPWCSDVLIREYSIGKASKDESGKQMMGDASAIYLQYFVIFFIKDSYKTGLL
jgi:hypothetical protein